MFRPGVNEEESTELLGGWLGTGRVSLSATKLPASPLAIDPVIIGSITVPARRESRAQVARLSLLPPTFASRNSRLAQ